MMVMNFLFFYIKKGIRIMFNYSLRLIQIMLNFFSGMGNHMYIRIGLND